MQGGESEVCWGQGVHRWTCKLSTVQGRGGPVCRLQSRCASKQWEGRDWVSPRPWLLTFPWNEPSSLPGWFAPLLWGPCSLLWWGGHSGHASGHDEFYGFWMQRSLFCFCNRRNDTSFPSFRPPFPPRQLAWVYSLVSLGPSHSKAAGGKLPSKRIWPGPCCY